jgi:hypothetical protein
MRALLVAAVGLTSVLGAAPIAEAHKPVAPRTCGIRGATTELLTHRVRLVVKEKDFGEISRWYACLRVFGSDSAHARKHGFRKQRFVDEVNCIEFCNYDLAIGDFFEHETVALTATFCSSQSSACEATVRVVALRSGRRSEAHLETTSGYPFFVGLAPTGTAVWIARQPDTEDVRLAALSLDGDDLVFDEGPDLSEFALTGRTLYWKRAGDIQTATVP